MLISLIKSYSLLFTSLRNTYLETIVGTAFAVTESLGNFSHNF